MGQSGFSDLDRAVRGGTRSAITTQIASQFVSLAVLAVLYRLVTPDAFGTFAIAFLLVMLPRTFVTLGLHAAAIQRPDLTSGELTAVFWWNLILGIASALMTIVAVVLVTFIQQAPDLHVVGLSLSGSSVVASLGLAHQMLLERNLRIVTLNRLRLGAQFIAGVIAIVVAAMGGGIWSLLCQHYLELVLLSAAFWFVEKWRPGHPRHAAAVPAMLRFGGNFSISSLLFYLALNVDKLLLYLFLGSTVAGKAAIGMYQQAFNLMQRPVLAVTGPISAVMLPALSRAQDKTDLRNQLLVNFFRLVGIVLLPVSVGLTLVATDAMLVIGGPRWEDAGWLLAVLAPAIAAQGLINICGSIMTAANRTREMFWGALCLLIVVVQGYLAGFYFGKRLEDQPFGAAFGMASGYTCVTIAVLFLPYLWYCAKVARISLTRLLAPLILPAIYSTAMGIVVFSARRVVEQWGWPPAARLTLLVFTGAMVYVALARREIRWVIEHLRG